MQHDSTPLFPMAPRFTTFLLGQAEITLFGLESDLCLKAFRVLLIFFHLSFSSFCDLFAAVTDFLQGLLPVEKLQFTQSCISVHISGSKSQSVKRPFPPADLEYRWCQFWLKVMTQELEQKVNAHHSWLWVAWESMG